MHSSPLACSVAMSLLTSLLITAAVVAAAFTTRTLASTLLVILRSFGSTRPPPPPLPPPPLLLLLLLHVGLLLLVVVVPPPLLLLVVLLVVMVPPGCATVRARAGAGAAEKRRLCRRRQEVRCPSLPVAEELQARGTPPLACGAPQPRPRSSAPFSPASQTSAPSASAWCRPWRSQRSVESRAPQLQPRCCQITRSQPNVGPLEVCAHHFTLHVTPRPGSTRGCGRQPRLYDGAADRVVDHGYFGAAAETGLNWRK